MSRSAATYATCAFLLLGACSGEIDGSSTSDPNGGDPTAGAAAFAGNGGGSAGGGSGGAGGSAGVGGAGVDACATPDTGASVLRRLSREEYRLTLQQLFQLGAAPDVGAVPQDAQQGGFRTVAEIQSISDQHLLAYLEVAEQLGGELMADAARRERVLGCDAGAEACLPEFVERFGRLAFRRALTAEESSSLVTAARANAIDASDAYRFAIESLLTAPSFLFRVEGGSSTSDVVELAPTELASRLSFMLWGRGPSAELLARAEAGELATREGIAAIAAEMLTAPQARDSTRDFFKQWLHFEALRAPNTPPEGFTPELLPDMIGETERVLDDFAWQDVRFTDVLNASYTYLTPALGEFYGLTATGSGFSRVDIPASHPRAGTGLFTHASVISSKTDADLISHRGAFLRDAFLCEKLSIPADLQAEIQSSVAGLSYPEVIALRNSKQPCAGCHAMIDPIGGAFAAYDAIGHYDGSVSASDYGLTTRFEGLTKPDFSTLAELASNIAAEPKVEACIAKKLFIFTHGREPDAADACALEEARARFAQTDGRLPSILAAFVESPAFRLRRSQ